jgi:hypothetical protein
MCYDIRAYILYISYCMGSKLEKPAVMCLCVTYHMIHFNNPQGLRKWHIEKVSFLRYASFIFMFPDGGRTKARKLPSLPSAIMHNIRWDEMMMCFYFLSGYKELNPEWNWKRIFYCMQCLLICTLSGLTLILCPYGAMVLMTWRFRVCPFRKLL